MKKLPILLAGLLGVSALLFAASVAIPAATKPAATPAPPAGGDAQKQMADLVTRVKVKLAQGARTEAALATEIKEFDALLAEHKAEKTDAVAEILFMKAGLYIQIFDDQDKGSELLKQLKNDFPATQIAKQVDEILAQIAQQMESEKVSRALKVGVAFPEFAVTDAKDLDGKPLSLARFKGKVVLVDFWATWCGPCMAEMPNVVATYKKYHDQGFEIVGVSLDQADAKATLPAFLKDKGMAWPQYFDGLFWQNKLAVQYGVHAIPAAYLLDGEGKIIGKELRGDALGEAVAAALKK